MTHGLIKKYFTEGTEPIDYDRDRERRRTGRVSTTDLFPFHSQGHVPFGTNQRGRHHVV